ncbi:hypothetical protein FHG87_004442 [Trinorchestia longiramus]|nr:hypothetical protein FHG87_004442 [Trinorchestia longiramus]
MNGFIPYCDPLADNFRHVTMMNSLHAYEAQSRFQPAPQYETFYDGFSPSGTAPHVSSGITRLHSPQGFASFAIGGFCLEMPEGSFNIHHQENGVTTFIPNLPNSNVNPANQAPQQRPNDSKPKHENKPTSPAPSKRQQEAIVENKDDAQTLDFDEDERFVFTKYNSNQLLHVQMVDAVTLDLGGLWKITQKQATKIPPSFKCPCCVSLHLREAYHPAMITIEMNSKPHRKIVCPILLQYLENCEANDGSEMELKDLKSLYIELKEEVRRLRKSTSSSSRKSGSSTSRKSTVSSSRKSSIPPGFLELDDQQNCVRLSMPLPPQARS